MMARIRAKSPHRSVTWTITQDLMRPTGTLSIFGRALNPADFAVCGPGFQCLARPTDSLGRDGAGSAVPFVGVADSGFESDPRPPAKRGQLRNVQKLARGPVQF
jgi:hypothetical protein